jgi:hypothetical protein
MGTKGMVKAQNYIYIHTRTTAELNPLIRMKQSEERMQHVSKKCIYPHSSDASSSAVCSNM